MPELPDVEVFRRHLDDNALGRAVARVRVAEPRVLGGVSARDLARSLEGVSFRRTFRHGKVAFADAGALWLWLRFGMTGLLRAYRGQPPRGAHERVIFDLRGGLHLAFDCQRMFGRLGLTPDPQAFVRERGLGPDALAVTRRAFAARVGGHRGSIKAALMDQRAIAGVGNVYADEILFQARLWPRDPARSLGAQSLSELYATLRRVLARAIEAGADPDEMPRAWLTPVRGRGARCPRCESALEALQLAGRTSYACRRCQRRAARAA